MSFRRILASAFILPLALGLAACQKEEGPAEKAGKQIDKAASALGDKIESAGDRIQGAVSNGK